MCVHCASVWYSIRDEFSHSTLTHLTPSLLFSNHPPHTTCCYYTPSASTTMLWLVVYLINTHTHSHWDHVVSRNTTHTHWDAWVETQHTSHTHTHTLRLTPNFCLNNWSMHCRLCVLATLCTWELLREGERLEQNDTVCTNEQSNQNPAYLRHHCRFTCHNQPMCGKWAYTTNSAGCTQPAQWNTQLHSKTMTSCLVCQQDKNTRPQIQQTSSHLLAGC